MDTFALQNLMPVLPELLVSAGVLVLVVLGAFWGERSATFVSSAAIPLLVAAAVLLLTMPDGVTAFGGSFVLDPLAKFMKVLALFASAIAILMSIEYVKAERLHQFEYPVLILLSSVGMMIMISANDLITLYLGLELQSLASYVIAAFARDQIRSSEAGLKYFVLGALSSGMLLYGSSLIYGFSGSIAFPAIAEAVGREGANLGLIFGIVFLMAGLAFKIAAAPFHMWTPDVYEGAPTPVTTFFASAQKAAAMAIFIRVAIDAFPTITREWQQIIVFISIASMLLGAFAAIGQLNIKRLLAYSSINNVGFALMGLAAGTPDGIKGVLFYMAIYLAMTLGAFAFVLSMGRDGRYVEDIRDLSGLSRTRPLQAYILGLIMFSLAGIPPAAGFFAKFYVFTAAIEANLWPLALIGAIATVIGALYYLRIVALMFFNEPAAEFQPMPLELRLIFGLSGAFVLLFFLYPAPLVGAAEAAARALF